MVERAEFDQLIRDALSSLYDYAALETHPLASMFPQPPGQEGNRAEHLRRVLLRTIERLRPPESKCARGSVEWRPYLVLQGRYVEGLSLQELQDRLSLSERQLRREHSRAVEAVSASLWDRAFSEPAEFDIEGHRNESPGPRQWGDDFRAYKITREPLNIVEVVQGIVKTLRPRVQDEETELRLALPPRPPQVLADRVILRQVLLSLLSYALDMQPEGDVAIGAQADTSPVTLWIQFQVNEPSYLGLEEEKTSAGRKHPLEAARYGVQRLNGILQEIRPPDGQAGSIRLDLSLPRAGQSVVLVVDDQEPAIRMFRRYLSRSNLQVVGVREPEQVLPLARQLQPQAITLDVMMPTVDGWEILQTLQTDPETRHIPVIVCSVWNEPELASSLGAAGFLKKPITQADLLGELTRLELLDTLAAPC
jgi:CheY-like chemotaxis protein